MEKPEEMSSTKMFGGFNRRYKHFSPTLGCSMTFSIYFPPSPPSQKIPVLYWLSGLTCTDENFIAKSGAQRAASVEEVALVAPDTSPRGLNIEGEDDSWDFGVGAGFYLNATELKWKNWRMYDYVVKELPKLLTENFELLDTSKASIFGHSMGGHGALTIFLKNQDKYKSASAFAPIVNPINCPWGQKAFSNYLGGNKSDWEVYDATCLIAKYNKFSTPILIDQVLEPIIYHLALSKAPLLVNVYPYYAYVAEPDVVGLDYVLFTTRGVVVEDGNLGYSNMFDAMVDAMRTALERAGGAGVEVVVSETGWPSFGGKIGATIHNAKTYNNNLVKHVKSKIGTPKFPEKEIEVYLFSMFNENLKPEGIKRNYGLFYPNMTEVYHVNL